MSTTIRFFTMSAHMAGLRGICRIHKDYRYTRLLCFVGNVLAQLRERLRMPLIALFLPCLHRLNSLSTGTNRQLGRKAKVQASFAIHTVMGCVGMSNSFIPTRSSNSRCSSIETIHGSGQNHVMSVDIKFYAHCAYASFMHMYSISQLEHFAKKARTV